MKRTELLTQLIRTRGEMQAILDDLSETHLLQPGASGDWSVRDLLAHITAWEVDMLTNLGKVKRGAKPGTTQWTAATIQQQNESWHKEMRDRPLRNVLMDFDGVRKQTLRVLEGLSDQEASKPNDWLQGRSLADYIETMTLAHEREHLEHLRQWRAGGPVSHPAGAQTNGSGPRAE
jgi:uncharacterized damage-inducible protein DinB